MPFMIQPAEYCKIIYIIVVARIMTIYQERINSLPCVFRIGVVSAIFMGLIVIISKDAGVALIYVFTLVIMALAGGFSFIWFAAAGAGHRSDSLEQRPGSKRPEGAHYGAL